MYADCIVAHASEAAEKLGDLVDLAER